MKALETPYTSGIWEGKKFCEKPFVTIREEDLRAILDTRLTEQPASDDGVERQAIAELAYEAALTNDGRRAGIPWDGTNRSRECWLRVADAILAALHRPSAAPSEVERDLNELATAFEQPGHISHPTGPSSEVAALLRRAVVALARSTDVPAGYVLVPRDLLMEARRESGHGSMQASGAIKRIRKMTDAMIASAPAVRGEG